MDGSTQNKHIEIAFFDKHAATADEYNVFDENTTQSLTRGCVGKCKLSAGSRVLDLGCGSGVFSHYLSKLGMKMTAVDISSKLVELGRQRYPDVVFQTGDAENLEFKDGTFDCIFLGGVIHHFPNPHNLIKEAARVLKPAGSFYAFDPNRQNPFMWLYRDRSSPFYSSVGVTPNERPVRRADVVHALEQNGFQACTDYMSVSYRYVASSRVRWLLPVYNTLESYLFLATPLKRFRAFLLTWGSKKS